VRGEIPANAPDIVKAFEQAKRAKDVHEIVRLVHEHDLPRECVPTEWLNDAGVWAALLERMPMTAMIRNLATMTRVALIAPMSAAARTVVDRLGDGKKLAEARVHPIAVLAAMKTYAAGHGARGQHAWTPVGSVVDALDAAFYATFRHVEPSGKRTLLALDVSGSMDSGVVAGVPGLTPRVASAALALVTAATEKQHAFVAFTCASGGYGGKWGGGAPRLTELDISPRWRLDRVVTEISGLPFGGTDCAQPMLWALDKRVEVDTFVIYTDSETWAGSIHPAQALREYRQRMGIPAKLVIVVTQTKSLWRRLKRAGRSVDRRAEIAGADPARLTKDDNGV
jgi:60 kDa SS-A/Ro ribonucleoprotein